MQSDEIRQRFLKFFEKRGHKIIPSASLVPENDPSVLFNTAGMQPLVPYLLGQEHPMGKRIVDVQKCVRTGDLDDIGDNRHFSFFEMMGNWSLGDYFKEDAIKWSYEFLTSKEEGLGLEVNRLYFTIFEGDENAPFDQDSKDIWMSLGILENRIYALPANDNWWSPGDNGPCGPCSEMFYDMSGNVGDLTKEKFLEAQKKEDVIEIWNDVFMEYEKKDGKVIGKLKQKNVDTGAGLERITAVMQGKQTAYDTDLFKEVIELLRLKSSPGILNNTSIRIIADHLRGVMFMISDGAYPSNKDRGYVVRRLMRRALVHMHKLGITKWLDTSVDVINIFFKKYQGTYPELGKNNIIREEVKKEIEKFTSTFNSGLKELEIIAYRIEGGSLIDPVKRKKLSGLEAFNLYQTYGFPIEITLEICKEKNIEVDLKEFKEKMAEHQKLSQTASVGMFKGGLANHNEKTIRLHTAHHLLLAGLQAIVDKNIKQRGSNITEERLRMDFLCDHKLTEEEKKKVEALVNEKIKLGLNVVRKEMPLSEAQKIGAEMEFGAKYPEVVSVYFIESPPPRSSPKGGGGNSFISAEFCGGPHVKNTSELGQFKILKEEAVAQGIRRIKAVLV
jgi:alanyl-tRNA synthetase